MIDKEIALGLEGIKESPYGGFWIRLLAQILDGIFLSPLTIAWLYVQNTNVKLYFYLVLPYTIIVLAYYIFLPKKYGATPGKLVLGLTIIKVDGTSIGWKEALLRYLLPTIASLISVTVTSINLSKVDPVYYDNLSWMLKSKYLQSLNPELYILTLCAGVLYLLSLFVLLFNKQKRATHDFIAGTEVIKKKYLGILNDAALKEQTIF